MPEDFFAEETRNARQALRNLTRQTGEAIKRDVDISPLIAKRPFVSVAAAAAGGAVAGFLLTPRRKSPEAKAILRVLRDQRHAHKKEGKEHDSGHGVLNTVVDALKPALNTVAASVAGMIFHNVRDSRAHDDGPYRPMHPMDGPYANYPSDPAQA